MAVNYTDVQKTEKYISRTNFDALEMAAVPEGTEFNIVDQIHESDLDSDVLQKLNNNAKINTENTFTAAQTFKKDITIEGNIIQKGKAYETHAEKLYTKNDMIYTRDGATAALADNAYTGIQAVKYDGTNDGQLVFGKDGVARVGDIGKTQPLATRAEKDALTDGHVLQWDAAGQTLIDSGRTLDEFARVEGDNTFTGNNTFTKHFSVYDEVSGNRATLDYNALTLEGPIINETCMLSPAGLEHRQMDDDGATILHKAILAFEKEEDPEDSTTTITVPNKTGTLALTSDLPVANPTAPGTSRLARLKIGSIVYSLPDIPDTSNFVTLSGAQTISGNKTFTGDSTFSGTNTFDNLVEIGGTGRPGTPGFSYCKLRVSYGLGDTDSPYSDYGYMGISYKHLNSSTPYSLAFPQKSGTFALIEDTKHYHHHIVIESTTGTITDSSGVYLNADLYSKSNEEMTISALITYF